MGRCNNRRTQAAAEAMKNTPSRARFSKGPPNRNNNKNKERTDNTTNNNNNNNTKNDASQRVIDKIQTRLQQQQQQQQTSMARVATTEQALQHMDKTKLDELKLPREILENITNLLEALGVKEKSASGSRKNTKPNSNRSNNATTTTTTKEENKEDTTIATGGSEQPKDEDVNEYGDDYDYDSDDDSDILLQQDNDNDDNSDILLQQDMATATLDEKDEHNMIRGGPGYQEYDDDHDEFNNYGDGAVMRGIVDVDREDTASAAVTYVDMDEGIMDEPSTSSEYDEQDEAETNFDDVEDMPAFVHLTQRLSFTQAQAARACRAIGNWNVLQQEDSEEKEDKSSSSSKGRKMKDESIGLAMDWLCLHLTEEDLALGFRSNVNPPPKSKDLSPVATQTIRAIPHPSISVAKSITSDKGWAKAIKLQQRIVGFVRWGFHHSEASQACEASPLEDESSLAAPPPDKDPALLLMLTLLEQSISSDGEHEGVGTTPEPLNTTDLEYVTEECEQEREALVAIYDDLFEFHPALENDASSGSLDRYAIRITPAEELQPPARQEDCQLVVFLRPGYPVVQSPSFLFINPNFPPTLLRRINEEITKKARESLGAPVVFEVVSFLSEELADFQMTFIKEQRRKEFEAEQLKLRKQAGHNVDDAIEAQYEGKVGRRQRAKLKSAEKAYDREDQKQTLEEEWRKRQDERMERVKEGNHRVGYSRAQRVIEKREQERAEAEVEKAARAAMNDAFNRGESVEEARAAASRVRLESLRANGVETPNDKSEQGNGDTREEKNDDNDCEPASDSAASEPTAKTAVFTDRLSQTAKTTETELPEATPTTVAFMDRLRQMYEDAVEKKAAKTSGKDTEKAGRSSSETKAVLEGYHLEMKDEEMSSLRQPRPVAVPTGELGEVMNDVIAQQKDQPWLISTEARAPTIEVTSEAGLSSEQRKRQQDISKKLRAELLRKRKHANEWARHNSDQESNGGSKGPVFTPKKFHGMLSVRRR
jgi:hypothetical protein